jgi:hypothetical protein
MVMLASLSTQRALAYPVACRNRVVCGLAHRFVPPAGYWRTCSAVEATGSKLVSGAERLHLHRFQNQAGLHTRGCLIKDPALIDDLVAFRGPLEERLEFTAGFPRRGAVAVERHSANDVL